MPSRLNLYQLLKALMNELTLADLQLHIENMYDQLDPDQIDSWPVDGLEITVDGRKFTIRVEDTQ